MGRGGLDEAQDPLHIFMRPAPSFSTQTPGQKDAEACSSLVILLEAFVEPPRNGESWASADETRVLLTTM